MLPDIRFLVGAVLASAVLIVSAFGLAATVRVAQHARLAPLDVSRPLAYAEPIEHIYGADRRFNGFDTDPLLERLAAIPAGNTDTNWAGVERQWPAAPKPPVEIIAPLQDMPVVAETIAAPEAKQVASPEVAPAAPQRVAALPAPTDEAAPVDVSAKPAVAPHRSAPKAKAAAKQRRVAKARRVRPRIVVRQPTASTGYPISGGSSAFDNQFFHKDRKAQ